jgi:hypothetical protein
VFGFGLGLPFTVSVRVCFRLRVSVRVWFRFMVSVRVWFRFTVYGYCSGLVSVYG